MRLSDIQARDKDIAVGQSTPEYVTVILAVCGIAEEWTKTGDKWVSSVAEIRQDLSAVVDLIKSRTANNVQQHAEARKSVDWFKGFLKKQQAK